MEYHEIYKALEHYLLVSLMAKEALSIMIML